MAGEGREHPLMDEPDILAARRTEAAALGRASINWVMAALLTANGGAALALLGQPAHGTPAMIALGLYVLGITCALVGGKIAADFGHLSETLLLTAIYLERANRGFASAGRSGDPERAARNEKQLDELEAAFEKQRKEAGESPAPEPWLAFGIVFFFFGCIAAGFALF